MKLRRIVFYVLIAVLLFGVVVLLYITRRGYGSPTRLKDAPAPTTIPLSETAVPVKLDGQVMPEEPLAAPPGFTVVIYASDLQGPRGMAIGPDGQLYVAERGANRILRLPDQDEDGHADALEIVASELDAPSSLAFYQDGSLYVGETTQIMRLSQPNYQGVFQDRQAVVSNLPEGGHSTRTVIFSPDWRYMFVSIGSSCNVCIEEDRQRAAIIRYNSDGSGEMIYARGLRNAVGITFRPGTQELWATNNGRDALGDDLPPETVYLVQEGGDYGWPYCHAGRIVDPDLGNPDSCTGIIDPAVEMQAHSAPLGLTFYNAELFPEDYQGDLFIAFHGSWNRTYPTGYKIVRIPIRDSVAGPVYDFVTGWLRPDGSRWGRPVDLVVALDGALLVSDDMAGKIYRIIYLGE